MPSLIDVKQQIISQKYILSLNPILWVPLWQNAGNTFMSADGYGSLCVGNGAVWSPQGKLFNGTSDINYIANNNALRQLTSGAFTIFIWFQDSSSVDLRTLLQNGDSGIDFNLQINRTNVVNAAVVDASPAQKNITGTTVLQRGGWYNVAFTSNNVKYRLYVNTLLNTIVDVTATGLRTVTQEITIGARYNNNLYTSGYDGIIGDVVILNRPFSDVEVQQFYTITKYLHV